MPEEEYLMRLFVLDTDDNETLLGGFAGSLAASWDHRRGAQFVTPAITGPVVASNSTLSSGDWCGVRQAVRPAVLDESHEGLARVLGSA